MNTLYKKNGAIKSRKSIIVYRRGKQIICPTHEILVEDGWEVYIKPEPAPQDVFIVAQEQLKTDIIAYDSSNNVNLFYMNGVPMWLDKATRAGLMLRFESEEAIGRDTTTLWYDSYAFTLPLEKAKQMLYVIEVYASACYDNTQQHLANVDQMTTIEELEQYDYTIGYPDKLNFND